MALDPRLILAGTPHVIGAGELQQAQAQNQLMQMRALQIEEERRGLRARNALMGVMSTVDPATGMPSPEAVKTYSMQFPEEGMKLRSGLDQMQQQRSLAEFRKAETAKIQAAQADRLRNQSFDLVAAGVSAADAALKANPDPAQAKDAGVKAMVKEIDNLEKLGGYSPDEITRLRAAAYNFDPIDDKAHLENRKSQLAREKAAEAPPKTRTRIAGDQEVQEQFNVAAGKWEEIGRGPRFARQVAPIINVGSGEGGGGGKAPSGYRWSKENAGQLEAIPGGPADPSAIAAKKAATSISIAGGRESVFVNRVVQASRQAIKDIENISKLPLAAQTTGLFGGRHQGPGLFDATKEVLAQKLTGQDAQTFNVIATGLQRALAQIETAGVAQGIQEFSKSIDVVAKEGDTQLTKLHKMAQMRQIIDAAAESALANERVPQGQRDLMRATQEQAHKAIPFTHSDLIDMETRQETNPKTTLRDVLPKIKAGAAAPEGKTIVNRGKDEQGREFVKYSDGSVEQVK